MPQLDETFHHLDHGPRVGELPGDVHLLIELAQREDYGPRLIDRWYRCVQRGERENPLELLGGDVGSPTDPPPADGDGTRQPATHRRLLDALPLRGTRTLRDAATRAGLDPDDARNAAAELELLGFMTRDETPHGGEERWRLHRRE